jgi:hypothetical protein
MDNPTDFFQVQAGMLNGLIGMSKSQTQFEEDTSNGDSLLGSPKQTDSPPLRFAAFGVRLAAQRPAGKRRHIG